MELLQSMTNSGIARFKYFEQNVQISLSMSENLNSFWQWFCIRENIQMPLSLIKLTIYASSLKRNSDKMNEEFYFTLQR